MEIITYQTISWKNHYETKIHTWQSLYYLAFTLIFIRDRQKIKPNS